MQPVPRPAALGRSPCRAARPKGAPPGSARRRPSRTLPSFATLITETELLEIS